MDLVLYNISLLDWANQDTKTCLKLKRLMSRVNIGVRVDCSGGLDASHSCAIAPSYQSTNLIADDTTTHSTIILPIYGETDRQF